LTADDQSARDPLLTLTHARVRAGQGDLRGARKVLRAMLQRRPEHGQAQRLLDRLAGPPESMTGDRIRRLEAWLSRLSRPASH